MTIWTPLRKLYIKTTDLTGGYQDNISKLKTFYRWWSKVYDISVRIDPGYDSGIRKMIAQTVQTGDKVLDIGCGTGLTALKAAKIAHTVTAVDVSSDMVVQLKRKIAKQNIANIHPVVGRFPDCIDEQRFDAIISAFAIVHFSKERRRDLYKDIFNRLKKDGRLGLFSARGEIAGAFETREELLENLNDAGFSHISVLDISDIYRIISATV